jgi:hypothetical protein
MIFCIFSTFLILLQNGIVMLIMRVLEESNFQPLRPLLKIRSLNKTHASQRDNMPIEKVQEDAQKFVKRFDKISFLASFMLFLLFTLIFCLVYIV